MQNHGQKMAYYEGEDGKLYYNFPQGLKVVLREGNGETAKEYTLEIIGCKFSGDTEFEHKKNFTEAACRLAGQVCGLPQDAVYLTYSVFNEWGTGGTLKAR